ncbi:TrmE-type G domain-containing protein [Planctomycetales bacterium 10988]|nr:TrmE-type G domain-containing protein [Planctomycetales bacterium 10988]
MDSTFPSSQVTQLTPSGRGAVATLRLEGPLATSFVNEHFQSFGKQNELAPESITFGRWRLSQGLQEEIVLKKQKAVFEIHCHGGTKVVALFLEQFQKAGFKVCSWQDWLMSQTSDRFQAEAELALTEARTELAAELLFAQGQGILRSAFVELLGMFEQEAWPEAGALLESLERRAHYGRHLCEPWNVVIVGRPNMGKSSLINTLLGYERAIVHDQPGTTRDVVATTTVLQGWLISLTDTAGMRETGDFLEASGIDRAKTILQKADLILFVFDQSQPLDAEDLRLAQQYPQAIPIANKCDLPVAKDFSLDKQSVSVFSQKPLLISASTGKGIELLTETILHRLIPEPLTPQMPIPFSENQVSLLQVLRSLLIARDVEKAREVLYDWLS